MKNVKNVVSMEVLKSSNIEKCEWCHFEQVLVQMILNQVFQIILSDWQLADKVCHALRVYDMLLVLLVEFDAGSTEVL